MTKEICKHTALVLDDHPLVARGIADYLRAHSDLVRVEAIGQVAEAWEHILQFGPPALILVDFWLADGSAIPMLQQLRKQYPQTRLLVISGDDSPLVRERVHQLAVDGFLLKQAAPAIFAQAVLAVLQGKRWQSEDIPSAHSHDLPTPANELGLTRRQGEVLALMLKGQPNKRIALALSVSEQTVKEHVSGILDKLGARNRIELIMQLRGRRIDV